MEQQKGKNYKSKKLKKMIDNEVIKYIHLECVKVRAFFEEAQRNMLAEGRLDKFPSGCCGLTCRVLGPWLLENISMFQYDDYEYVCGYIGKNSHAWLEIVGIIVDITADQFDGVCDKVIVNRSPGFHSQFTEVTRHKISLEDIKKYPENLLLRKLKEKYSK